MRTLAVLAVIALLIVAAIIYFSDHDLGVMAGNVSLSSPSSSSAQTQGAPGTASQASFAGVSGSLQHDMSAIPNSLDAPGVPPRTAFNVKSRLGAAASTRPEYRTLVRACELIIYADQEHSVRQAQAKQAGQGVSSDLMATSKTRQLQTDTARTAVQSKAQADWEAYRLQTDQEVTRLLHSLP